MDYPIETLRGRIIETHRGARYQIREFDRAIHGQFIGHGYIFEIASAEVLDKETSEMPPTAFLGSEWFRAHFAPFFKIDGAIFGFGEDGRIEFLLEMLKTILDEKPVQNLQRNEEGQLKITFDGQ